MTISWALTALSILLASLVLYSIPRLLFRLVAQKQNLILFSSMALLLFILLLNYWGLTAAPTAFFFAIALAFGLIDHVFGFSLYINLMIFRPWELWPSDSIFSLIPRWGGLYILTLTALDLWLNPRKTHFKASRIIILFFVWCLLSALVSPTSLDSAIEAMTTFLPSIILFFLIQFWMKTQEDYDLLVESIAISLVGVSLLSIFLFLQNQDQARIESVGIFANSNDIAALCILAIPLALRPYFSIINKQRLFSKLIALMTLGPFLIIIYLAKSRGAWLGLFSFFAVLISIKSKKISYFKLGAMAALASLVLTVVTASRSSEDLGQSQVSRIAYIEAGLKMAAKNPIFGVGYGRYPSEFENYSTGHEFEFGKRTAHNTWILILAETGLPGLMLFIFLFISAVKESWKIKKEHPEILFSLVGYGIAMTFLSHSFLFYPYLVMGIAFGASQLHARKEIKTS